MDKLMPEFFNLTKTFGRPIATSNERPVRISLGLGVLGAALSIWL